MFVTAIDDVSQEKRFQKIIKLKRNRLSEDFLQYLRANLIFSWLDKNLQFKDIPMLVSCPVHLQFEIHIVSTGLKVLQSMLGTPERKGMYATTL